MSEHLRVLETGAGFYKTLAAEFCGTARAAIAQKGEFTVALSGGNTPVPLYERLAEENGLSATEWNRISIFQSDERCVPPDHPRSNYRMIYDTLLSRLGSSTPDVHRMRGEWDPEKAAEDYEHEIRTAMRAVSHRGHSTGHATEHATGHATMGLDLILLGLGSDGHTASLFPGGSAIGETTRLVMAQKPESQPEPRLTFTPAVFCAARQVWVIARGAEKAAIARKVLLGPVASAVLPAQVLRGLAQVTWWLDRDAAKDLCDSEATLT